MALGMLGMLRMERNQKELGNSNQGGGIWGIRTTVPVFRATSKLQYDIDLMFQ